MLPCRISSGITENTEKNQSEHNDEYKSTEWRLVLVLVFQMFRKIIMSPSKSMWSQLVFLVFRKNHNESEFFMSQGMCKDVSQ